MQQGFPALLAFFFGIVFNARGFAGLTSASTNRAAVFGVKDAAKRTIHVHVYVGRGSLIGVADGEWKALSVQFVGGEIETVEMARGAPLHAQKAPNFFQVADLSGSGATFHNGLAASVMFSSGTDMENVEIDYESINTYVVQYAARDCVPRAGAHCASLPPVYFNKGSPPAVVAFAPATDSTTDLWVFAADKVSAVSVGFQGTAIGSWTVDSHVTGLLKTAGADAFGFWRLDGGTVPTGTKLATITAPADACVAACVDAGNKNSNVEYSGGLYDAIYVYGAALNPSSPCDTCTFVEGGGDATKCQTTGSDTCAANGRTCYAAAPTCACDGVSLDSAGPDPRMAAAVASCKPPSSGEGHQECRVYNKMTCWSGSHACLPTTTPCFVRAPSTPPAPAPAPSLSPSDANGAVSQREGAADAQPKVPNSATTQQMGVSTGAQDKVSVKEELPPPDQPIDDNGGSPGLLAGLLILTASLLTFAAVWYCRNVKSLREVHYGGGSELSTATRKRTSWDHLA